MHAVSSLSPPGFIITYDTRLIRSSPNRICGFMIPAVANTSPVDRSQRWPATVVEPTSIAMPNAVSTKPGQMATAVPSRSTAIVTEPWSFAAARWAARSTTVLQVPHLDTVRSSDGLTDQFGDGFGIPEHRLRHVDVEQRELRIDHETAEVDRLAHHLLVNLALGRHGDDGIGENHRRATEATTLAQRPPGVALGLVVDLDRRPIRQRGRLAVDGPLGERTRRRFDLATTADAPTAAHRIEIDPELARRGQHRGTGVDFAGQAGRGENDPWHRGLRAPSAATTVALVRCVGRAAVGADP